MAAGVSSSYINHLEVGDRDHPTRAVVDALVAHLDRVSPLSGVERRHLFDLAGLHLGAVPAVAQLRAEITPDMRRSLAMHGADPAGYFDSRWNILALNDSAVAAMPGLSEGGSVLHWLFGNQMSGRVLLDWEHAAMQTVAALRGRIGQSGSSEWPAQMLDELGRYPEFRRMWSAGEVAYAADHQFRMRDLLTGNSFLLNIQVFDLDAGNYPGWIRFFLGTRSAD